VAMGPWASKLPDDRSWHPGINPIARLKPGVTVDQARAEMSTIAKRIYAKDSYDNIAIDAVVNPMQTQLVSDIRPALTMLLGAVIFVLLIACGNIANLMLTRATARRREIAIRISLGASDWKIIQQLIVEGLVLSLTGAVLGVGLAYLLMPTLVHAAGGVLPAGAEVGINGLVVSEISLALLLLMGAGLFVRSLNRLSAVSMGFSADHLLVADLPVPPAATAPAEVHKNMDFYDNTLRELRVLPGVKYAGATSFLPVSGQGSSIHFNITGRPPRTPKEYIMAGYRVVSSEYFQAMQIPLIQGRWIQDSDREGAQPVVVINQAMAKKYFGDQSALGKKMALGAVPDASVTPMIVVGVVGDVKQTLATDVATEMYVPFRQANELLPVRMMSVVMRTGADPQLLIPELRETVRRINPDQPVVKIRTMEENVAQNFSQPQFRADLLIIFAGLALLIAGVGVYGVMAYSTAQRAGEMAIRMALGCSVERIFRLVITDGLRLTLIGVAIGTGLSVVLGHWLKSLLFGVSSTDGVTLAGAIAVVVVAGVGATVLPARRAARVQIAKMMREN
jgi:putative ABC transport system permease protein